MPKFNEHIEVDQDTGDYDGKKSWPAWYYGPKGQSQAFDSEEEVPDGWHDHPSKVGKSGGGGGGGQRREPVESKYKEKTDAEVVEELKSRKIDFNDKWPRNKLEGLLLEDDKKAK